ncbi:hypothetical protein [Paraburkholderia youngii]|uniref:hypothetical protein n=1 Tax=Paraburkholderia youngii TaxID=2782701 RepID=UPI003D1C7A8B
MTVAELLLRLKGARPDAVVVMLASYADLTEAEELGDVAVIAEPWTCERHRTADGIATDVRYPAGHGPTLGWNAATDEMWTEHVVILSPQPVHTGVRLKEEPELPDTRVPRDMFREQVKQARRELVSDGTLLSEAELRDRLGVSKALFTRMCAEGAIFGVDVDGDLCYPALLADARYNRERIQEICRIIVPAGESRLDFLCSRRGNLGDRSPLEMLDDEADFAQLRRVARAWAAEFSRTVVILYEGKYEAPPVGLEPLYTAAAEIDPRQPLWERASEAIHSHGYEWPLGPYPEPRTFTLFVERHVAGNPEPIPEAFVHVLVKRASIRVRLVYKGGAALPSQTLSAGKSRSVVDVAKRVIAHLVKR